MRTIRVYSDATLAPSQELVLTGNPARHVGQVLRQRQGDELLLFDGRGTSAPAEILRVERNRVVVQIADDPRHEAEPTLRITLLHGLCRGSRMDSVIQKATELGATAIQPVLTERGVVKLDASKATKRSAHWQAVAISACEQSGRNYLPRIGSPLDLDAALTASAANDCRIILDPGATTRLGDALQPGKPVSIVTGPEGGFSQRELDNAGAHGYTSVALGPRVMRTETAPVVALGLIQYLLGDLAG